MDANLKEIRHKKKAEMKANQAKMDANLREITGDIRAQR
jgi:hypothetical protein